MKTETRPDEPAPWPLLRELGPEFFEVAVRAQVAWHGPTAAWAIALDLGVTTLEVTDALRRLRRRGELDVVPWRDGCLRWVLAAGAPDPGPLDLWTFTLGWLARRSLSAAVADLIARASEGATVPGDIRGDLGVLGDMFELEGNPWGLWIAALLSGSLVIRREHEAALAEAVRAKKLEERPQTEGIAGSFALPVDLFSHGLGTAVDAMQEINRALAQVSAGLEPMAEELRRMGDLDRGQATEDAQALVEFAATLGQDEAPARDRRRGPVGDRLRRRLGRGRR